MHLYMCARVCVCVCVYVCAYVCVRMECAHDASAAAAAADPTCDDPSLEGVPADEDSEVLPYRRVLDRRRRVNRIDA